MYRNLRVLWIFVLLLLLALVAPSAFAQSWISAVTVTITTSTATINWTTAVPANSQVKYGTTTNYGTRNALNPTLITAHSATLTALTAGTSYHFRVLSADASGVLVASLDYTFTTSTGPVSVSVSPATATVASAATQQFAAQVINNSNTAVTWSTTAGSVTSSGLFAAPPVTADKIVTVTATSVVDTTKSASATVTVKAPAPALAFSPTTLTFSAQQGASNPSPANVSITNIGGGTLNFTTTTDAAWLTVSPPSGTAPATLQLTPRITGLTPGTYTGHLTVTATGATNSPATVTVTLTVTAPLTQHSVTLSWSASTSSNVVSYSTYRSTVSGGPYALVASAITGLSYTDASVQSGVTYYYVVTATDNQGQESVDSSEAKAVVPSP
jgi:hypothetical protein